MRSKREIFEIVKAHLLAQGETANLADEDGDESGICAYLSPGGKKCAVGCLIPPEVYSPELEGCPFDSSTRAWTAVREAVPEIAKYGDLLGKLQGIHDRRMPYEWEAELAMVERDYL